MNLRALATELERLDLEGFPSAKRARSRLVTTLRLLPDQGAPLRLREDGSVEATEGTLETVVNGLKLETHRWSADDDETLRLNYAMWPAFLIADLVGCSTVLVYRRAKKLGLQKSPGFWRNPYAHLWAGFESEALKANRFQPGHVPQNKGLRQPGSSTGRMATTQFRKGGIPHTWVPIGSERVDRDGYRYTKVRDDSPGGLARRNWVQNHILVWNEHHGEIPPGHILAFKDGNPQHVAIENLELIDRAERMRRNTIHNLPPELVEVIRLTAGLKRRIRTREKQAE